MNKEERIRTFFFLSFSNVQIRKEKQDEKKKQVAEDVDVGGKKVVASGLGWRKKRQSKWDGRAQLKATSSIPTFFSLLGLSVALCISQHCVPQFRVDEPDKYNNCRLCEEGM